MTTKTTKPTKTTKTTKTSKTDVLVVGAGPAGLMLALWLARLGVDARIVDKRTDKVYSGQADGFQVRTLEILDSFGIAQRIWNESNHMVEVAFWNPDATGRICRSSRVVNGKAGLSRFHEVVLHQGRAETFFLDAIRDSYGPQQPAPGSAATDGGDPSHPRPISVERRVMPTSLAIDDEAAAQGSPDAYPVTVALRHLSEAEATPTQMLSNVNDGLFRSNLSPPDGVDPAADTPPEGVEEIVQCKYVVGCDGAHSWTRKALGPEYDMVGEMTDYIWGVLDIVPITDFPDIRNRTMIHSAENGSMMVIPRENRLVRLYIQLTEVSAGSGHGRVDRSQIKPDMIFAAAKKIMHPYQLDYHYCDWWTAYQIGQRVGKHFSKLDRVFLAGDAVHTHSPKAGQGMNVSMQDTFNLGWKLGLVCKGIAKPAILATYEFERRPIAEQLIAFDHRFSRLFSGRPVKDILDETGVSMAEFSAAFLQSHMFTTGVGLKYSPNMLVVGGDDADKNTEPETARSPAAACVPGMRFPSHQVLRHVDARPWQLHHKMQSDGRFRLVVFAGHVAAQHDLLPASALADWLATHLLPKLPAIAVMPGTTNLHGGGRPGHGFPPAQPPSMLDVLLVYHGAATVNADENLAFHSVYRPFDPKLGHDYDKVFVDRPSHHAGDGQAYAAYGVDPAKGAMVGVRPDGVVGLVAGLEKEAWPGVEQWLEGILCTAA